MSKIEEIFSWLINHAVILSIGAGVFMVFGGALTHVIFPKILTALIEWEFQLDDGNTAFKVWSEIPVPIKTKVYIFDLLNAKEFMAGRELPKLSETGPFVYRMFRKRESIVFSSDGEKVSYYDRFRFEYDSSQSNGNLENRVTVPNVPIISLFTIINSAISMMPPNVVTPVAKNIASAVLSTYGEELFESITIRELLEGRDVQLLNTVDALLKPLKAIGVKLPEYEESDQKLRDNKYGVIWTRNDRKGPFEVYTKYNRLTKFASYKGNGELPQWPESTECSKLSDATDGFFFGPLNANASSVRIFDDITCRTLRADFEKELSIRGVNTLRFRFSRVLFSLNVEENRCFCRSQKACIDGATDISSCVSGAPLAISYPHFLYADDQLSNRVTGLKPNDKMHRGYFNIDSRFGITLNGSGRFQINVMLKPIKFVSQMQNIKPTLLPYVWIDESEEIDESHLFILKFVIFGILLIEWGSIAFVILGVLLVIAMGGYAMTRKNKTDKQLPDESLHKKSEHNSNRINPIAKRVNDYENQQNNSQRFSDGENQLGVIDIENDHD